jgi:hypothetical protein
VEHSIGFGSQYPEVVVSGGAGQSVFGGQSVAGVGARMHWYPDGHSASVAHVAADATFAAANVAIAERSAMEARVVTFDMALSPAESVQAPIRTAKTMPRGLAAPETRISRHLGPGWQSAVGRRRPGCAT